MKAALQVGHPTFVNSLFPEAMHRAVNHTVAKSHEIPCQELRQIAATCRKAMISTVSSSGDQELDEGLMEATRKEVSKGFLVGPASEDALPRARHSPGVINLPWSTPQ